MRKKGYRKKKSFKKYKSKVPRKQRPSSAPWLAFDLPDRYKTKMKYEIVEVNTNETSNNPRYFIGNSIYSPDSVHSANNATGWTILGNYYQKFIVYASGIAITYSQANASTNTWQFALTPINGTNSSPANYNQALVQNYVKTGWVTNESVKRGYLKHYMQTAKINGIDEQKVRDDDVYSGNTAWNSSPANPLNLWYWQIYYQEQGTTPVLNFQVVVTYYVELYEKVQNLTTDQ